MCDQVIRDEIARRRTAEPCPTGLRFTEWEADFLRARFPPDRPTYDARLRGAIAIKFTGNNTCIIVNIDDNIVYLYGNTEGMANPHASGIIDRVRVQQTLSNDNWWSWNGKTLRASCCKITVMENKLNVVGCYFENASVRVQLPCGITLQPYKEDIRLGGKQVVVVSGGSIASETCIENATFEYWHNITDTGDYEDPVKLAESIGFPAEFTRLLLCAHSGRSGIYHFKMVDKR